jgi:hypothetical protein
LFYLGDGEILCGIIKNALRKAKTPLVEEQTTKEKKSPGGLTFSDTTTS